MGAVFDLDLYVDVACDYATSVTWLANEEFVDFTGATAQMVVRPISGSTEVLLTLSTTPVADVGFISLGYAPPGPYVATVSDLTALANYPTTDLIQGNIVEVLEPSDAFFAWIPGSPLTPDGVTIIASTGSIAGNWVLSGTIYISIANPATLIFAGLVQASYDLLVTWSTGIVQKILSGTVYIDQTETLP